MPRKSCLYARQSRHGASRTLRSCATLAAVTFLGSTALAAEPASAPAPQPAKLTLDYLATSPTLTGDWGGLRQQLADKGLTLDFTVAQVYQGVLSGGRDKGWNYGGRETLTLNLDTGKMGLWPGGFFFLESEGNYGEFVGTPQTGAVFPVNVNASFPESDGPQFDLVSFTYTQFVSPNLGFFFGKLDTTSGDANAFAHGKGDRQFLNLNLSLNPVFSVTVPYSTLGAGVIILPTGKPEEATITLIVCDSDGRADTSGFDTVLKGGTSYAAEVRIATRFFGLSGHQLLGAAYSDRLYIDLDQSLLNLIIPGLPIQTNSGSWGAYYNFDQYVYQPDPASDRGLGVFGRFGISDGIANPIHYYGSVGIGGKGLIPGREHDQFGIGYWRIWAASAQTLQTLNFHDSQGFEVYYEFAITPAVFLTPDFQIIEPGQRGADTSCVLGLRLTMKF